MLEDVEEALPDACLEMLLKIIHEIYGLRVGGENLFKSEYADSAEYLEELAAERLDDGVLRPMSGMGSGVSSFMG